MKEPTLVIIIQLLSSHCEKSLASMQNMKKTLCTGINIETQKVSIEINMKLVQNLKLSNIFPPIQINFGLFQPLIRNLNDSKYLSSMIQDRSSKYQKLQCWLLLQVFLNPISRPKIGFSLFFFLPYNNFPKHHLDPPVDLK